MAEKTNKINKVETNYGTEPKGEVDVHHDGEHAIAIELIQHPPVIRYHWTFGVLVVLLGLTVLMYYVDLQKTPALGWVKGINLIVALIIAITKAAFVVMNFMNVRGGTKLIWVWAAIGFIWLLLMGGIFLDIQNRHNPPGWQYQL